MSGTFAVELAKALDVINRDRWLADLFVIGIDCLHLREVEDGVQQHGGVADGEHEAIAVGPDAVFGIEAQHTIP